LPTDKTLKIKKIIGPIWLVLEYSWYPFLTFLSTPYLLNRLGVDNYGLWVLFNTTIGISIAISSGTSLSVIKNISSIEWMDNPRVVELIIRSSLALSIVCGSLLSVICFSAFWFGANTFFEKMGNEEILLLIGVLAAVIISIEQIDAVLTAALKGAEQFGPTAKVEISFKALQIILAVVAVGFWGSLQIVFYIMVLISVIRLIAKYLMVKRFFKIASFAPVFNNIETTMHYAKWGWVQGFGSLLYGVADRFLIGSMLGAASLAYYSLATQLAQQIHGVSAAGLSALLPIISRKLREGYFSLSKITKITFITNMVWSTALSLGLLFFGKNILLIWLGEAEADACAEILKILIIAYWLLTINVVPFNILLASGKFKLTGIYVIVSGVIALFISYEMIQTFKLDLVGAAIGKITYAVITMVGMLFALSKILESENKKNHANKQKIELP
jgi:O-antigen/teichoic acid export membrane protein